MSRVLGHKIYKEAVREKTHDGILHNAISNNAPFVSTLRFIVFNLLTLDLCVLVNVRQVLLIVLKLIRPVVQMMCLMSLGAGLLFTCAWINTQRDVPIQHRPASDREYSRPIEKEMLGVFDYSRSGTSAMEQELALLKSKTLSLDMTIRRMKMHLRSCYVRPRTIDEKMPDFASEAAGGSIISTPDTETYFNSRKPEVTLFGVPLWKANYFTPRKVIQPWTQAGECWAFRGANGKIEIELAYVALISHVTMDHIPALVSLTEVIDSAPRQFALLGKFQDEFVKIDTFTYDINGLPSQTFPVKKELRNTPFKRVILEVYSNWGNPDYTCIYRFRVHGRIYKDSNNSIPTKSKDEL